MQYYCKVLFLYNSNALVWVVLIVKTVDDSSIGSNNKKMSFNEWYYMYCVFCFTIVICSNCISVVAIYQSQYTCIVYIPGYAIASPVNLLFSPTLEAGI